MGFCFSGITRSVIEIRLTFLSHLLAWRSMAVRVSTNVLNEFPAASGADGVDEHFETRRTVRRETANRRCGMSNHGESPTLWAGVGGMILGIFLLVWAGHLQSCAY